MAAVTLPAGEPSEVGTSRWREVLRFRRSWIPGIVGIGALLVIWQIAGLTLFTDTGTIPPPTDILSTMGEDGWTFYRPNIETTITAASKGWFWANLFAIATAVAFTLVPFLERLFMQVAVATYCLPTIAVGGIMVIALEGDTPRVILAAISCYFTTLVGTLVGLRSADRASLDLIRAYGGNPLTQLWKVRLRASLPGMFAGLRIAAPAAMLGAIIGEWLGSDNGLGVVMVNSQQQLNITRTWGIALVITVLSAAAYGVTALVGNLLTPWAPKAGR